MATKMALINAEVAQNISVLQRSEGRQKIARALKWEDFDEEEEPRKGVILDFHYDNLMYCAKKGLPWEHIGVLVDLAATVLQESKDKSLDEAITIYHQKCQSCSKCVSSNNLKAFTEYFFSTFMRHYKLYQFVLCNDQELMTVKTTIPVETPEELLPFTDAKEAPLWEYEQKFLAVEKAEEKRSAEREVECGLREQEIHDSLDAEMDKFQSLENPIERQKLIEMINSIASAHITAASNKMTSDISNTTEDLSFMLEKTSIPRPQELGPPPRYKTRTPIPMPKRPKSPSKEKAVARTKSGKSLNQSRAETKSGRAK